MVPVEVWEERIDKLIKSKNKTDGARLQEAVEFARRAHAGDFRKSTKEPYIVHPYEVCMVASTLTDDVDVLIAALLHDVVEDTNYTAEDIREQFGDRVTGFVLDESEDKMENIPKAISWFLRKEKFLEHLARAPRGSQTICISDKISNLRSTAEMFDKMGDAIWEGFNQKSPVRQSWYYRTIADTIEEFFEGTDAFEEYKLLYEKLFGMPIHSYVTRIGGLAMEIDVQRSEGNLVFVNVGGRITSSNAEDFYDGAKKIIDEHPNCEMVYDLDNLEMISSAGLRVFLKLKKVGASFKIINASSEVYEVFEMTGFVSMFDIKKALRKMSIAGCTKIGEGAKGLVYKIDDETIIKVYKDPDCMDDIVKERECAKKALVAGVPTAIPFDIVLVGDRFGSVFELVNAKSVTKTIMADMDNMDVTIGEYAELMREMNSIEDAGLFGIELPKIKDEVKVWADFTKDKVDTSLYEKIQAFADDLKDVNTLLHGDGHPNNAMCTKDEMLFIDMDTLCVGDPMCDIAVVYTALIGYKIADPRNDFIPLQLEETRKIWKSFLKAYFNTDDEGRLAEIENWCQKFAFLRLYRRGVRKEANPDFAVNSLKALREAFE